MQYVIYEYSIAHHETEHPMIPTGLVISDKCYDSGCMKSWVQKVSMVTSSAFLSTVYIGTEL